MLKYLFTLLIIFSLLACTHSQIDQKPSSAKIIEQETLQLSNSSEDLKKTIEKLEQLNQAKQNIKSHSEAENSKNIVREQEPIQNTEDLNSTIEKLQRLNRKSRKVEH